MGDVFKTLTAGFSRFVMAWIVPSATTLAIFCVFVYGSVDTTPVLAPIARVAGAGTIQAGVLFGFVAVVLSLLFALGGIPLYRLLEGYTLPRPLVQRWRRAQLRHWLGLQRRYARMPQRHAYLREQLKEQLDLYPKHRHEVMPTRLGNAFKAIERYGVDQFGLDSQTFHYELNGVVPDRLRIDIEDSRAQVDFFLGFVWQLALLTVVSLAAAIHSSSGSGLILAVVSAVLARFAYVAALKNMTELRYAIQALVHLGRPQLATALGYHLPATLGRERELWRAWSFFVERRERQALQAFDRERIRPTGDPV